MKRTCIRKDVAEGMLMVGCLGLATPALAGVTVLDAPGLFKVFSPPNDVTADFADSGDFASAQWDASGDWGSFAVSASSAGLSATASSNAIIGVDTRFVWTLAMVFEASRTIQSGLCARPGR